MSFSLSFITRASEAIGYGHVVRSIALAAEAERRGGKVSFIAVDDVTAKVLSSFSREANVYDGQIHSDYVIRDLPGENVVDEVRREVNAGAGVLLMDDKGEARCIAQLVVDAMMTAEAAASLKHADSTRYLYGLQYVPLREEILEHVGLAVPSVSDDTNLLIALGGGFPHDASVQILHSIRKQGFSGLCQILLSEQMADTPVIDSLADDENTQVYVNSCHVGALLAQSDLLVTKLGMAQLEAFAVGLGCVTVEPGQAHLDVQHRLQRNYADWPVIEMGLYAEDKLDELAAQIVNTLHDGHRLQTMARRTIQIVDGLGASRIIDALLE